MRYVVPFENETKRTLIRKWAGKTAGASITKKTDYWATENDFNNLMWAEAYIIELKTKKAEMLVKLQFPDAREEKEMLKDDPFAEMDEVYFPSRN